ncbi:hypothetical protein A0H81_10176 [Grifola frondosa]|uniref:Uncharacterized protein n=1 Tax=Grifola frondosa TaxID=5627 RepID=A0A1C7M3W5_GRIFR|nr:hypothetical protein A0H81_10176 [Grifola frondosa]
MRLDDTLTALTYLASGSFTILRLFAVGVKDWKVLVCLAALCLVRPTISVFEAVGYAPIAIGSPLYGCMGLTRACAFRRLGIVSRSTTIAADTLLIVYTWYKTYGTYAALKLEHKTSIAYLLLRDGTIYFVSIVLIHILSIISDTIGSGSVIFSVWAYFDQVFTPIFLCRLILNLREVDNAKCGNDDSGGFSDLHFSSIPFGNLGAPLDFARDAGADVCAEEGGDSASLDESSPGLPSHYDGMELPLCDESGPSTSTQGLDGSAESSGRRKCAEPSSPYGFY